MPKNVKMPASFDNKNLQALSIFCQYATMNKHMTLKKTFTKVAKASFISEAICNLKVLKYCPLLLELASNNSKVKNNLRIYLCVRKCSDYH